MIYLNVEDLGWRPFITSWIQKKTDAVLVDTLWKLIDKFMHALTEHKRLYCRELVPCDRLSAVRSPFTCINYLHRSCGVDCPFAVSLSRRV